MKHKEPWKRWKWTSYRHNSYNNLLAYYTTKSRPKMIPNGNVVAPCNVPNEYALRLVRELNKGQDVCGLLSYCKFIIDRDRFDKEKTVLAICRWLLYDSHNWDLWHRDKAVDLIRNVV